MQGNRWDVFISYSSRNYQIAKIIADDLERVGMEVWFDQSTIKGGERIRAKINEGIRSSRCIVILISRYSLLSRWVLNELDAAMLREIAEGISIVVPVLIGRVDASSLPEDIKGKRYIDLRHNFFQKYSAIRTSLIGSILNSFSRVKPEDGMEIIPIGDAVIRRIARFRYNEIIINDNIPLRAVLNIFFEALSEPKMWREDALDKTSGKNFKKFIRKYGEHSMKELIGFIIDHHEGEALKLYPVDEKTILSIFQAMKVLVNVFALNEEKLTPFGVSIDMVLRPNRSFGFRVSPFSNPQAIAALEKQLL